MRVCKHGKLTVLIVGINGMYLQLCLKTSPSWAQFHLFCCGHLQIWSKQWCLDACQTVLSRATTKITQVCVIMHVFTQSKSQSKQTVKMYDMLVFLKKKMLKALIKKRTDSLVNVFNCIFCSTQYFNTFSISAVVYPLQNSSAGNFSGCWLSFTFWE